MTSPFSTPACSEAPTATTSSGFTPLFGSLPPVSSLTASATAGIRVEPPTRMTWSISDTSMPASLITAWNGARARSSRSLVIFWNSARESFSSRCSGPDSVRLRYGRWIVVSAALDSSILAFSACSCSRCMAILSPVRSVPYLFLNCFTSHSTIRWSQSSPPRWLSPLVAFTSKTPSPISSSDTSKVPPPRSKTRMVCSVPLSRPYASAAAVGSLTIRCTFMPAISPASLVAWRCASEKYAGTVMTASVTCSPRYASASRFSFCSTNALICCGVNFLPSIVCAPVLAHVALDGADRAVDVRGGLALRHLADQDLAVLGEGHHRGRRPRSLGVGDDGGLPTLEYGDDGVRRTQIDTDRAGHVRYLHEVE